MNSIYTYLDYREFLKDFYDYRKQENPYFSYRLFGRMVDMDASLLAKVLLKARHISDDSIASFASACKLPAKETAYFENLVHFAKAKSDAQAKIFFEKLLGQRTTSARQIENKQYEYYRKWYHSVIRSMLEYYEFTGDYKALGTALNPAITAKEAKDAIALLLELDLIAVNESGRYVMTDKSVTTGDAWRSIAVQAFQEETLLLAREALARHPRENRDISTITMAVSKSDVAEISERIREFRSSIIQYVNESTDPDRVYQLNLQLLPLTTLPGDAV